ncbi:hypothetical protein [Paenibacillus sp. GCM10027626]|uniref:hypothetical protein n=1 Tax=Paenibacillus sp. GCM10027626 TaxID=3273411 RepID=UPI0036271580
MDKMKGIPNEKCPGELKAAPTVISRRKLLASIGMMGAGMALYGTTRGMIKVEAASISGGEEPQLKSVPIDENKTVYVMDYIPEQERAAIIAGTSTYDCTSAIQQAINDAAPFEWQGSVIGTNNIISAGIVKFSKGKYRVTAKIRLNPCVRLQGERPNSYYSRHNSHGTIIWVDYSNPGSHAFDSSPYNTAGVRVDDLIGEGGHVHLAEYTSAEGIEIKDLYFIASGDVKFLNIANGQRFVLDNVVAFDFITGITVSATWFSSMYDVLIYCRYRGIEYKNSVNNLNCYNLGISTHGTRPYTPPAAGSGFEPDPSLAGKQIAVCGIYGGMNMFGFTAENVDIVLGIGSTMIQADGCWYENITDVAYFSSYSNLMSVIAYMVNVQSVVETSNSMLNIVYNGIRNNNQNDALNYARLFKYMDSTSYANSSIKGLYTRDADNFYDPVGFKLFSENANNNRQEVSIYVANDGKNSHFGDAPNRPVASLSQAIEIANAYEGRAVIYLKSGNIHEVSAQQILKNKSLHIQPYESGSKPVIRMTGFRSGIEAHYPGTNISIDNCVIENAKGKDNGFSSVIACRNNGEVTCQFTAIDFKIAGNSQIVGMRNGYSFKANIFYNKCTINGHNDGISTTYGWLAGNVSDTSAKLIVNEYAQDSTISSSMHKYGSLIRVVHSDLN